MAEDEYGEYDSDAGSPHPVTEGEMGYIPCNAVLKHTWSRYGERRYCKAMAMKNFVDDGSRFCKQHKAREHLMKQHAEDLKTGAYAKSHKHTFQYLPPHKQIMANDLYESLLEESTYDYETETKEIEIDISDKDFGGDEVDTLVISHKVPVGTHRVRAKALWFAALDFVSMESIREEQFRVAAEESHDGRKLTVGEREKVVSVTDYGLEVRDVDEHHLNLPLSRLQKDYERHMKFGGVEYDVEGSDGDMTTREWVVSIEPEEPEIQPEAQPHDSPEITEIEIPEKDED